MRGSYQTSRLTRLTSLRFLILCGTVLLLPIGCANFGEKLSEEAKPQTPAASFIVSVAEFNFIANEANIWLSGVVSAAQAGDTEAIRYLPTAKAIGQLISVGTRLIQQSQAAFLAGDLTGFLADGEALNRTIADLQRYVTEVNMGGGL